MLEHVMCGPTSRILPYFTEPTACEFTMREAKLVTSHLASPLIPGVEPCDVLKPNHACAGHGDFADTAPKALTMPSRLVRCMLRQDFHGPYDSFAPFFKLTFRARVCCKFFSAEAHHVAGHFEGLSQQDATKTIHTNRAGAGLWGFAVTAPQARHIPSHELRCMLSQDAQGTYVPYTLSNQGSELRDVLALALEPNCTGAGLWGLADTAPQAFSMLSRVGRCLLRCDEHESCASNASTLMLDFREPVNCAFTRPTAQRMT